MKLETIKTISQILGIIALPIITLILGNNYTKAIKEREIQGKFVELAVQILNAEPTEENKNIRSWSVDVINLYSGVKINKETRTDLINNILFNSNEERTIFLLYQKATEYYENKEFLMSQSIASQLIYEFSPSSEMLAKIILLEGKSFEKLGDKNSAQESLNKLIISKSVDQKIKSEAEIILKEMNQ